MTVATLMPDAVLLALGVLAADEDVVEIIGDAKRIVTVSPADTSTPWIRLHRIGGVRSVSAPMRLAVANVQVDCFAPPLPPLPPYPLFSGDPGAMALALVAEAALFASAGFANAAGIIAYVSEFQGPQSVPDTSRTPPTPRVLLTLALTVRPI